MEHQSWMIEADHVFGPLNEEDDDDLKNHWNNLNDALNTKLKGTINVPDYGEVKNDGSILLFCHQLLHILPVADDLDEEFIGELCSHRCGRGLL